MSSARRFSKIGFSTAPPKAENKEFIRLVVASFRNGSMSETERTRVLKAAQQANVSETTYLRGRLLLAVNIAEACPEDQK